MGYIDRYPTYKGGKVTEVVVYANYIGFHRFYRYVVNISRWSPYEGGQLDRFHCTIIELQASEWEAGHVSIMQRFMSCIMWLIILEDSTTFIFSESFRFVVFSPIFNVNQ